MLLLFTKKRRTKQTINNLNKDTCLSLSCRVLGISDTTNGADEDVKRASIYGVAQIGMSDIYDSWDDKTGRQQPTTRITLVLTICYTRSYSIQDDFIKTEYRMYVKRATMWNYNASEEKERR